MREEEAAPLGPAMLTTDPNAATTASIRVTAQSPSSMHRIQQPTAYNGQQSIPMMPSCCGPNKFHPHHQHLSNVFVVGYLGSAILTKGKTGLGCLQQPLRELYYIYRQNGARLLQERRVFISMDGITMIYNEYGVEKFLHNDLSSVYDIQLLQLICENNRKDKNKLHCAFLPIGK